LLVITTCLAAGVAITALIAWLAAMSSNIEWHRAESKRAAISSDVPSYLRTVFPSPIEVSQTDLGFASSEVEVWCCADPDILNKKYEWNEGPLRPTISRFSFGWPMRAMYYDMFLASGGTRQDRQGLFARCEAVAGWRAIKRFPRWVPLASGGGGFRAMPRAVLPIGFAVDALTIGLTLPMLALAFRAFRRWRRQRRGLCTLCGYSRTGLSVDTKCPECGASPRG
jgi:hypothetical protein